MKINVSSGLCGEVLNQEKSQAADKIGAKAGLDQVMDCKAGCAEFIDMQDSSSVSWAGGS
jgi:hypothetical protein